MKKLLLGAVCLLTVLSLTACNDGGKTNSENDDKNNAVVDDAAGGDETTTEKEIEITTETTTEKATEATTEKATEATTEKATEATTEKETEITTEKVTEATTEKETEITTEKTSGIPIVEAVQDYVISSKVTSADETAEELRKCVDNWLTDMDSMGFGMKTDKDNVLVVYMSFSENNSGGRKGNKACSTSDISAAYTDSMWNVNTDFCEDGIYLENRFEEYIGDLLPFFSGTAVVVLRGGVCEFAALTPDSDGGTPEDMSAYEIQTIISAYIQTPEVVTSGWITENEGVGSDGQIYGTSPKV